MHVDDILQAIRSGYDIRVKRVSPGRRTVAIVERITGLERNIELETAEYEAVMTGVIDQLAAAAQKGSISIELPIDYFGQQWVKVTSGRIIRTTSKINISHQRISQLERAMTQLKRTA